MRSGGGRRTGGLADWLPQMMWVHGPRPRRLTETRPRSRPLLLQTSPSRSPLRGQRQEGTKGCMMAPKPNARSSDIKDTPCSSGRLRDVARAHRDDQGRGHRALQRPCDGAAMADSWSAVAARLHGAASSLVCGRAARFDSSVHRARLTISSASSWCAPPPGSKVETDACHRMHTRAS